MAKLRYDHAVEAIITLQRYLDTCADDRNTLVLVRNVQNAVKALVKEEESVYQRHEAGMQYGSDVISAMEEVEAKVILLREQLKPLREFVTTYRPELLAIKDAFATLGVLSTVLGSMKGIEKQLELARRHMPII